MRTASSSIMPKHHAGHSMLRKRIDRCILDLRPAKTPETRAQNPADDRGENLAPTGTDQTLTRSGVSASLQAAREALLASKAEEHGARKQERIDKALDEWRATPRGEGHRAFYGLACALQRAGLDHYEIKDTLHQEAACARSPAERRGEIGGIAKGLR